MEFWSRVAGGLMREIGVVGWTRARTLGRAVAPVAVWTLASCGGAGGSGVVRAQQQQPPPRMVNYSALSDVSVGSISVMPLNSPPINGFTPQVVFGLTAEFEDPDDLNFFAFPSATPSAGDALPSF